MHARLDSGQVNNWSYWRIFHFFALKGSLVTLAVLVQFNVRLHHQWVVKHLAEDDTDTSQFVLLLLPSAQVINKEERFHWWSYLRMRWFGLGLQWSVPVEKRMIEGGRRFLIWPGFVKGFFSSRCFGIADLTPAFFPFKNAPYIWFVFFFFLSLLWWWRVMMACFADNDSSIRDFKLTIDLLSAHCKRHHEGITHNWPWNNSATYCPITFGP